MLNRFRAIVIIGALALIVSSFLLIATVQGAAWKVAGGILLACLAVELGRDVRRIFKI